MVDMPPSPATGMCRPTRSRQRQRHINTDEVNFNEDNNYSDLDEDSVVAIFSTGRDDSDDNNGDRASDDDFVDDGDEQVCRKDENMNHRPSRTGRRKKRVKRKENGVSIAEKGTVEKAKARKSSKIEANSDPALIPGTIQEMDEEGMEQSKGGKGASFEEEGMGKDMFVGFSEEIDRGVGSARLIPIPRNQGDEYTKQGVEDSWSGDDDSVEIPKSLPPNKRRRL